MVHVSWPVVRPRSSATPWYSGVQRTTHCSPVGYCDSGKNVAAKRNMGMSARFTKSKSVHDRINAAADERPRDFTTGDVTDLERGRQHGIEGVRVLVLEEEVEGGVEHR